MKTQINLSKMKFRAFHGVLPHEGVIGGDFEVNLLIEADLSQACESDDVRDTISYADVYDIVKEEMDIPSKLLEHIGARIYNRLLDHYQQITSLEVKVSKFHPPLNGEVEKAEIVITK
ncbi:MAG TPA: dihydroneopterin aldolase [Fermentimonas sp.]|nr:dihydroneopterin aldolase [Fermentimonas sp.]